MPEMLVILVIALLLFGKRLPEVAVRAAAQVVRARRTLTDMWRQTGIDDELRKVRRDIDAEQRRIASKVPDLRKELPEWKEIDAGLRKPQGETVGRQVPASVQPAAEGAGAPVVVPPQRPVSPPQVRTTGLVTPPGVLEAETKRES